MKNKILTASLVFLMSVSSFSCGRTNDSQSKSAEIIVNEEAIENSTENTISGRDVPLVGFSTKENERKVLLGGSQEEIDYNTIIEKNDFYGSFVNFLIPQNPLQLEEGTDENAYVVKPFKYAVVDEYSYLGIRNAWYFPVASENGRYIGMVLADCSIKNRDDIGCSSSQKFAPELNEALEKGSIAIFSDGGLNSMYGIYEDNTIITLSGDEDYKGSLTFDEVNQEVNLITSERINEKIEIDSSVYDRNCEVELIY